MEHNVFSDITPDIVRLADLSRQAGIIEQELFTKYEVKRGLRDLNGKGVLAGLTTISDVRANKIVNGEQVPTHGELFYRGYNVRIWSKALPQTVVSVLKKWPICFYLMPFRMRRSFPNLKICLAFTVLCQPASSVISL